MKYFLRLGGLVVVVALSFYACQNAPQTTDTPPSQSIIGPALSTLAVFDELTPIDIPLAEGSGIVAAGVGLRGDPPAVQPGTININVPGDVVQVILYWEGHMTSATGDDQVTVEGTDVTGTLIGGPTNFFVSAWSSVYRADITSLGVVNPGANAVEIGGMDYNQLCPVCTNNGAGILVIYDDGSGVAHIDIRDGLDLAFYAFDPPLDTTVPQTFDFGSSDAGRIAELTMFASSVAPNRPNVVVVTIDGTEERFVDPFQNLDGPDWDTVQLLFTIPAGATSLTVQALSEKDITSSLSGNKPASLAWLAGALTIEPPELTPMGCRVTGGVVDESGNCVHCPDGSSGDNTFTCGGQAGANTALPPQPSGNWTHSNKKGPAGKFTFHGGTPSAPEGTEIEWINCNDPGWCSPARRAPAKQIDFGGIGTFKNMSGNVPPEIADHVTVGESLHRFEVNIDDAGEPGKGGKQDPPAPQCPVDGFGLWGSQEFVNCDCPDFYRITIYAGTDESSGVIYEASGWIRGGNLQIHPLTGFDSKDGVATIN
jgi:hypothetical protein